MDGGPSPFASPRPLMRQEPLHELQPFFAGINTGNGPTENQTRGPAVVTSGLRCAIASFISGWYNSKFYPELSALPG